MNRRKFIVGLAAAPLVGLVDAPLRQSTVLAEMIDARVFASFPPHPLLLEGVIRFQSNARAELLPSKGPVRRKLGRDTVH